MDSFSSSEISFLTRICFYPNDFCPTTKNKTSQHVDLQYLSSRNHTAHVCEEHSTTERHTSQISRNLCLHPRPTMDTSPSIYQQPPRPNFFRTRLGEFVLLFFILYYTLAATILLFIAHKRRPRQEEIISARKAFLPLLTNPSP